MAMRPKNSTEKDLHLIEQLEKKIDDWLRTIYTGGLCEFHFDELWKKGWRDIPKEVGYELFRRYREKGWDVEHVFEGQKWHYIKFKIPAA